MSLKRVKLSFLVFYGVAWKKHRVRGRNCPLLPVRKLFLKLNWCTYTRHLECVALSDAIISTLTPQKI